MMEPAMTARDWKSIWEAEEALGASAADPSWLAAVCREEPLPWDFARKAKDFLKPGVRLLYIGAGGGEELLALGHDPRLTSVTVDNDADWQLCQKRLVPLGMTVKRYKGTGEALPFADAGFDLVLNDGQPLALEETARVLRPGGFFVTQQTGGMNGRDLARRLLPGCQAPGVDFNLENQLPGFRRAGFRIIQRDQAYPKIRFAGIGGLCRYARSRPGEFPGFSVEACFERLLRLQEELESRGFVEMLGHRFLITGKKAAGASVVAGRSSQTENPRSGGNA